MLNAGLFAGMSALAGFVSRPGPGRAALLLLVAQAADPCSPPAPTANSNAGTDPAQYAPVGCTPDPALISARRPCASDDGCPCGAYCASGRCEANCGPGLAACPSEQTCNRFGRCTSSASDPLQPPVGNADGAVQFASAVISLGGATDVQRVQYSVADAPVDRMRFATAAPFEIQCSETGSWSTECQGVPLGAWATGSIRVRVAAGATTTPDQRGEIAVYTSTRVSKTTVAIAAQAQVPVFRPGRFEGSATMTVTGRYSPVAPEPNRTVTVPIVAYLSAQGTSAQRILEIEDKTTLFAGQSRIAGTLGPQGGASTLARLAFPEYLPYATVSPAAGASVSVDVWIPPCLQGACLTLTGATAGAAPVPEQLEFTFSTAFFVGGSATSMGGATWAFRLSRAGELPSGYRAPSPQASTRSPAATRSSWTRTLASALRTDLSQIAPEERAGYVSSFTQSSAVNARLLDATSPQDQSSNRPQVVRQWALEAVGLAPSGGNAGSIAALLQTSFERHLVSINRVLASPNPISVSLATSPGVTDTWVPCGMSFAASGAVIPTGTGCMRGWTIDPFTYDQCAAAEALGLASASEFPRPERPSPTGINVTARYQPASSSDLCGTYQTALRLQTPSASNKAVDTSAVLGRANAPEITACANAPARIGQPGTGLASSRLGTTVLPVSRDLACTVGSQSMALAADYLADSSLAPRQGDTEAACAVDLLRLMSGDVPSELTPQASNDARHDLARSLLATNGCVDAVRMLWALEGANLGEVVQAQIAHRLLQQWVQVQDISLSGALRRVRVPALLRGAGDPRLPEPAQGLATTRDALGLLLHPVYSGVLDGANTPGSLVDPDYRSSFLATAYPTVARDGDPQRQLISASSARMLSHAFRLAALVQQRVAGSATTAQSATRVALVTMLRLRGLEDRVVYSIGAGAAVPRWAGTSLSGAREETFKALQDAIDALAPNPLSREAPLNPGEIPILYQGAPRTADARFSAISDYLLGAVGQTKGVAASAVSDLRRVGDALAQANQRQDEQEYRRRASAAELAARMDEVRQRYGQKVADWCGTPNGLQPRDVLEHWEEAAGRPFDAGECFRREGVPGCPEPVAPVPTPSADPEAEAREVRLSALRSACAMAQVRVHTAAPPASTVYVIPGTGGQVGDTEPTQDQCRKTMAAAFQDAALGRTITMPADDFEFRYRFRRPQNWDNTRALTGTHHGLGVASCAEMSTAGQGYGSGATGGVCSDFWGDLYGVGPTQKGARRMFDCGHTNGDDLFRASWAQFPGWETDARGYLGSNTTTALVTNWCRHNVYPIGQTKPTSAPPAGYPAWTYEACWAVDAAGYIARIPAPRNMNNFDGDWEHPMPNACGYWWRQAMLYRYWAAWDRPKVKVTAVPNVTLNPPGARYLPQRADVGGGMAALGMLEPATFNPGNVLTFQLVNGARVWPTDASSIGCTAESFPCTADPSRRCIACRGRAYLDCNDRPVSVGDQPMARPLIQPLSGSDVLAFMAESMRRRDDGRTRIPENSDLVPTGFAADQAWNMSPFSQRDRGGYCLPTAIWPPSASSLPVVVEAEVSRSILADVDLESASARRPARSGGGITTSTGALDPTSASYTTYYQGGDCANWYPTAQPMRSLPPANNPTTLDTGACYSGDLGTEVIGLRALSLDIRAAREDYETFQENYDIAVRGCNLSRDAASAVNDLQAAHNRSMTSLRRARNAMETVALAADAAKGCADAAAAGSGGAVLSLGVSVGAAKISCGAAVVASGARIASTWIQDAMDEAEQGHQLAVQRMRDDAEYRRCMNDAGMNLTGARAAMTRVERARQELLRAEYQLREDKGDAADNYNAGRQLLADLQSRTALPPDTADLRDSATDQYERALTFAKRALRLAAAAVSYEQQLALPDTIEQSIRGAQYPWDLENVLNDLRRLAGTRRVLGSPPENRVAVLSLRDDILQLQNRQILPESEQRLSPSERFRMRLASASSIVRDGRGAVLGRRLSFALAPVGRSGTQGSRNSAVLEGTGCAERLWNISAAVQTADASGGAPAFYGSTPQFIPLEIRRSNTSFFSQWCGDRPAGAAEHQLASYRPSNNPLLPSTGGAQSGRGVSIDYRSNSLLRAFLNVDPRAFESDGYSNGGSSELAGRGLYGQYEIFIPESAIGAAAGTDTGMDAGVSTTTRPGLNLSTLSDIVLRLEYVSVARPIHTLSCESGKADCDGEPSNGCEADLARDGANCGACGTRCESGVACSAGACQLNCPNDAGTAGCSVRTCQTGFSDCDGMAANGCEVETATSAANCGACGRACPAGRPCVAGQCSAQCSGSLANCDGNAMNGCETDLQSSAASCGRCGATCMPGANQTATCVGGQCQRACGTGYLDCDGNPANGCEVDPVTSAANCGGCGRACTTMPNATASCSTSSCVRSCNTGFGDCDGLTANGCETDVRSNSEHCGMCGNACPNGQGCVAGACSAMACRTGRADCNASTADGCEVPLTTDLSNCGMCGNTCLPRANSVPSCASGACGMTCTYGFRDCDRSSATGCEASIFTDANNCGGCGTVCTVRDPATQQVVCNNGTCGVTCRPGRADCNGSTADGCETDVTADTANCGACRNVCPLPPEYRLTSTPPRVPACGAATCLFRCSERYRDCNGNGTGSDTDLCETDALTDPNNCGGCRSVCAVPANGSTRCVSSTCQPACNNQYANCDGDWTNGCETATATDRANCGACSRACPGPHAMGGSCDSGQCTGFRCEDGWGDCDGNPWNGCETRTATDTNHCGACGNVCRPNYAAVTAACVAGQCGDATCQPRAHRCDTPAPGFCRWDANDPLACGGCGIECAAGQSCVMDACR